MVEVIVFILLGCIESKTKKELEAAREMTNYHGIEEGASWTYRDDGADFDTGTSPPDDASLILAHHVGNGFVELRRGVRWVEAEPLGHLEFSVTEQALQLISWELPTGSGSGNYLLSDELPDEGEVFTSEDWSCTVYRPEYLWTYYGYYDDVVILDCTGGGLSGYYAFGKGAGLIRFEGTEGYSLDLVAPW